MPPIIIAGAIAAAGAVGGAAIASHGANSAAETQAAAANQTAQLAQNNGQQALQLQNEQYQNTQAQQLPFLQAGQGALANLANLFGLPVQGNLYQPSAGGSQAVNDPTQLYGGKDVETLVNAHDPRVSLSADTTKQWQSQGIPYKDIYTADGQKFAVRSDIGKDGQPVQAAGAATTTGAAGQTPLSSLVNPALGATGSLSKPYGETWTPPTGVTEQNDPGYQFRLAEGMKAIDRQKAATGDYLSPGTTKGLERYAQDYASNEFGNVYNRSLTDYTTKYNAYNQDQNTQFNRLASLLGVGQTSAAQLQGAGQNLANSGTTILNNVGTQQSNDIQNAAAARASGYVGSGNAWGSAITGLGNNFSNLALLNNNTTNPNSYLQYDPTYGYGVGYHP